MDTDQLQYLLGEGLTSFVSTPIRSGREAWTRLHLRRYRTTRRHRRLLQQERERRRLT
jgi:hypothetical protein